MSMSVGNNYGSAAAPSENPLQNTIAPKQQIGWRLVFLYDWGSWVEAVFNTDDFNVKYNEPTYNLDGKRVKFDPKTKTMEFDPHASHLKGVDRGLRYENPRYKKEWATYIDGLITKAKADGFSAALN